MLVIYQGSTPIPGSEGWDALGEAAQRQVHADYGAINAMDDVTAGPPLGLPRDATTIVVEDDSVVRADGPHLGAAGAVGGFMIVEGDDLDDAIAVAARVPAARLGGAIEIRPVATYW